MELNYTFTDKSINKCYNIVRNTVKNYGEIIAALVFGSVASNTQSPNSDLDIIFILNEKKSISIYRKIRANKIPVDLNIYSSDIFQNKLKELEWQYRLSYFQIIQCKDSRFRDSLLLIKELINTETARKYRIINLTNSIQKSINFLSSSKSSIQSLRLSYIQAICHCVFLHHELNKIVPFQPNNNILYSKLAWYNTKTLNELIILSSNKLGEERNKIRNHVSSPNIIEIDFPYNLNFKSNESFDSRELINLKEEFDFLLEKIKYQKIWEFEKIISVRKLFKINAQFEANKPQEKSKLRHTSFDQKKSRLKLIIPTGGCRVPLCTFCDLPKLAFEQQNWNLESLTIKFSRINELVLYTDGSFFDKREIDDQKVNDVIQFVKKNRISKLTVESLPRFLEMDKLENIVSQLSPETILQINIGIQSVDENLRYKLLSTPLTNEELLLINQLKDLKINLRVYLLFGKPLQTEAEELLDISKSIEFFKDILDENDIITVNPLHISNGTLINHLFKKGYYKSFPTINLKAILDNMNNEYSFNIELGTIEAPTCSDIDISSELILNSKNFIQPFGLFDNINFRLLALKEISNGI